MKRMLKFQAPDIRYVDKMVHHQLNAVAPGIRKGEGWFSAQLEMDDPRIPLLNDALDALGIERSVHEYDYKFHKAIWQVVHVVEPEDLDKAELLRLITGYPAYGHSEEAGSEMLGVQLPGERLPPYAAGVYDLAKSWGIAGKEEIATLQAMEPRGFILHPTRPYTSEDDIRVSEWLSWEETSSDAIFEMRPTVRMPPLSPRVKLRDKNWNPVSPGTTDVYAFQRDQDDLFPEVGLHYSRAAVEAMGPFDMAWPLEHVGGYRWAHGQWDTIVSARLYRFLASIEPQLVVWPVYLDD